MYIGDTPPFGKRNQFDGNEAFAMVFVTHPPARRKDLDFCPSCGTWLENLPSAGKVCCPVCQKSYTYVRDTCDNHVDASTWRTLAHVG